jgi:MFS family permease
MSKAASTLTRALNFNLLKINRAFHWIWFGQAVSVTGSQLSAVSFQLIAVTTLRANASEMGILTAAQTFPYLCLGLFLGAVIDNSSRRLLLISSDFLRSAVLTGAAVLAAEKHLTIHLMWVIVCLTATFNLVFDSSLGAFIPDLLKPSQWSGANSRLSATVSAGEVTGPALAGFIVQVFAAPSAFLLDALSYIFSAICVVLCKPPRRGNSKMAKLQEAEGFWNRASKPVPAILEGLNFVIRHPILRIFGLWSAIWNFSWSAVLAVLVLYASRTLRIDAASVGICFAVGGLGGVLGASLATSAARSFSRSRMLVYAPFVGAMGATILLWSSDHPRVSLAASLFIFNVGQSAFGVNMQTTRQLVTPTSLMGRMDTTMRLCFTGMSSLGALAGGFIGSRFGLHGSLVFGIAGLFVTAIGLRTSPLAKLVNDRCDLTEDASEADTICCSSKL